MWPRPLPCFHPVWLHEQCRCFWGVLVLVQQQLTLNLLPEFNCWTFLGLWVWVRPGVSGAEQFGLAPSGNIIGYHQHNNWFSDSWQFCPGEEDQWTLWSSRKVVDLHRTEEQASRVQPWTAVMSDHYLCYWTPLAPPRRRSLPGLLSALLVKHLILFICGQLFQGDKWCHNLRI